MSHNPYTPVSIAGYNVSPPSDDGAKTSGNQLEWGKHKTKLGDPLKTGIEGVDAATLAAFDTLVMTEEPAAETVIGAMDEFIDRIPMLAQRARRADVAVTSDSTIGSSKEFTDPTENVVVMMQEFT